MTDNKNTRKRKSRHTVAKLVKLGYPRSHIYKLSEDQCLTILELQIPYRRTRKIRKDGLP